jgi:hypothetical protein
MTMMWSPADRPLVGLDRRLRHDRQGRGGKTAADGRFQEHAAVDAVFERGLGNQAVAVLYEVLHVHPFRS